MDTILSLLDGSFDIMSLIDSAALHTVQSYLTKVIIVIALLLFVFLTLYTLRTFSLYTMAKRLGLRKPIRAFYPIVEYYIMGSIADAALGDGKKSRAVITVFKTIEVILIAAASALLLGICAYIPDLLDMVFDLINGDVTELSSDYFFNDSTMGTLGLIVGASLFYGLSSIFTFGFNVAYAVVSYRLYSAFGAKSPTLMTVLTFLFQPFGHVYLFCIRKRTPKSLAGVEAEGGNGCGNDSMCEADESSKGEDLPVLCEDVSNGNGCEATLADVGK